jgi:hypothetical protein
MLWVSCLSVLIWAATWKALPRLSLQTLLTPSTALGTSLQEVTPESFLQWNPALWGLIPLLGPLFPVEWGWSEALKVVPGTWRD